MKNKYHHRNLVKATVITAAVAGSVALAGTEIMAPPAPIEEAEESIVSGSLNLDFNSHFVSYGLDVWADGGDMSDPIFNPSFELAFALPRGFTGTIGAWADVNNRTVSTIGGRIQEIDVWLGLAYTFEKLTVGVTYQNWFYAGETEEILDLSVTYDTFLAPSLTVHQRLDRGGAVLGDEGTVIVVGVSHSVEAGPVTISVPLNVAYFATDNFHAPGADSGFGYASLAVAAAVPLPFMAPMGDWTLNASLTYYVTDDAIIPNPRDHFLTASVGLGLTF